MRAEIFEIDGKPLKIYSSGQGIESVLLIHGLGSSARDWEHQLPVLQGRFRVIALDLRGHGASSRDFNHYSIPAFTGDVIALLEKYSEPVHVVGVSMGGMIGYELSAVRPDLVKSLTVINAIPEFGSLSFRKKLSFLHRLFLVRFAGMRAAARKVGRDLFPSAGQDSLRATFIERWSENSPAIYRRTLLSMASWSVVDRLPEIATPTLVITGDRDYIPPERKQMYALLMPDCRVEVITNSGHATPVDQSEALNKLLVSFICSHEDLHSVRNLS